MSGASEGHRRDDAAFSSYALCSIAPPTQVLVRTVVFNLGLKVLGMPV